MKTKKKATSSRGPRPIVAFAASLAVSSILMGFLLLSDRRVLELRRARAEVQTLDRDIAEKRRENEELRAAIDAANRHEFPAEKVAREELNLVQPDEVVLLYPSGSLTNPAGKPPSVRPPNPSASPAPRP